MIRPSSGCHRRDLSHLRNISSYSIRMNVPPRRLCNYFQRLSLTARWSGWVCQEVGGASAFPWAVATLIKFASSWSNEWLEWTWWRQRPVINQWMTSGRGLASFYPNSAASVIGGYWRWPRLRLLIRTIAPTSTLIRRLDAAVQFRRGIGGVAPIQLSSFTRH